MSTRNGANARSQGWPHGLAKSLCQALPPSSPPSLPNLPQVLMLTCKMLTWLPLLNKNDPLGYINECVVERNRYTYSVLSRVIKTWAINAR